jgi:hypothetical protein
VPTTIHVPPSLLAEIDARAKALGVTRNRFIVQTLAEKVQAPQEWPAEFVRALERPVAPSVAAAADEMAREIESARRSRKRPPAF